MEADLWLSFGTFSYGLEGRLVGATASSVNLSFTHARTRAVESSQADDGVKNLLDLLGKNTRSLVRSEVRLFLAPEMVSTFQLPESRIALTSSFGPEVLQQSRGLDPILRIQAIEPIQPMDLMLWREFILRIWPQLQE